MDENMERLTEKIEGGYMLKIPENSELSDLELKFNVYDKLGTLEDAEEQGKLLKLICNIGDTIYYPAITMSEPRVSTIYKIEITKGEILYIDDDYETLEEKDFGVKAFLSEREAKQKMLEMAEERLL